MREIKFRAWDEIGKWMGNVTSIDFDERTIFMTTRCSDDENCFELDKTPVMQSTGLKDKNDKEIYEGDIVKKVEAIPFIDTSDIVGVVKFVDGSFLLEYERWGEKLGCYLFSETDEHEILGNVHENPELLGE
ncbi:YopX family protein [Lysinibacillus sp. NPDC096418]|uniref:YopX family protein n=1 Tax=Lysinibacillus sp. NPDC096418 TaxID=3364138 RepID=UPI003828A7AB